MGALKLEDEILAMAAQDGWHIEDLNNNRFGFRVRGEAWLATKGDEKVRGWTREDLAKELSMRVLTGRLSLAIVTTLERPECTCGLRELCPLNWKCPENLARLEPPNSEGVSGDRQTGDTGSE